MRNEKASAVPTDTGESPSIETTNSFNEADNLSDSGYATDAAEELANDIIAQLRAVGLRD